MADEIQAARRAKGGPANWEERMDRDELAVNTIRTLAIDAVEKAKSGHPGMPLGAAPMAHVIWTRHLRFDPTHPQWPNRDRFILSAGHGSMLLYALLHLSGFGISIEDLKQFRQWESVTPGHPENTLTPGVEVTTGPLGQGFANGVGMAMAEAFLAAVFNRPGHEIFDHRVYGICSDGDLMEGISSEAASLAGHLRLGKLIYLYDRNGISIDGSTDLTFTEDVGARFKAYGWHVQQVDDGNDLESINQAIEEAKRETDRPSLVIVLTHIGYGSPHKQDSAEAHGAPLGAEEVRLTKMSLGWPPDLEFYVPERVRALHSEVAARGVERRAAWSERFEAYSREHPDQARLLQQALAGEVTEGWEKGLPSFCPEDGPLATRSASGKVLNGIARYLPTLVGGSADLAASNNSLLKDCGESPCGIFQPGVYRGRNIYFGVREHAMGGILNGMAHHGGVFPYGATFLIFSDYLRPSIRLAALSRAAVTYVFTHDSVGLGEDGPTHQPTEHLPSLRAMPNLWVIRPSDASEVPLAWKVALERRDGPVALVLTRQNLPVLDRSVLRPAQGLVRGGYILAEAPSGTPELLLLATGSEVHVALEAQAALTADGVQSRVVALPCWELFEEQDEAYRNDVLPPEIKARVAVEAASTFGWRRYVGDRGRVVGVDRFGVSAPGALVLARLGINTERVVAAARSILG